MGFPEFATQSAIDYFTAKKSASYGPFSELEAQNHVNKQIEEQKLAQLEHLFPEPSKLTSQCGVNGNSWSYDDITIFPRLRSLTCVKGFVFPHRIAAYMKHVSECAQMPLWTDKAI